MKSIGQNNKNNIRYREPFLQKEYGGYYYIYFHDLALSKRRKVSTHLKIQYEAIQALKKFRSAYIRNQTRISINTISELRDTILRCYGNRFSASNLSLYKMSLNNLIKIISDKPLRLICYLDIEFFMNERVKSVSENTVNLEFRTIRAALNIALKNGEIDENPAKGIKQFKSCKKRGLNLSSDELQILLKVMEGHFIKNLTLFGLYTGCRPGEIANIQIGDIDLDNGLILIRNKDNWTTKTKHERDIPISNDLKEILNMIRNSNEHKNVFKFCKPTDYLFLKKNGSRYTRSHLSRLFKKFVRKAGLDEKFHLKCLRHSAFSILAKKGVPLNQIREIAGHETDSVINYYLHTNMDELRKAVNLIKI